MAYIDMKKRSIFFKIVYYGPPYSGKTTNIRQIYNLFPPSRRGEIYRVVMDTERAVFLELAGQIIKGYQIRYILTTLPGYTGYAYDKAHMMILHKCDACIYVADSRTDRWQQNMRFLYNLRRILKEYGMTWRYTDGDETIPVVIQWNKTDITEASAFNRFFKHCDLNREMQGADVIHAVATEGIGVYYALKYCVGLMNMEALGPLMI